METFDEWGDKGRSKPFVMEACMGAGKSRVAAEMAKRLLDDPDRDRVRHVFVLCPTLAISDGHFRALGSMGIEPRESLITNNYGKTPELQATVTTYHDACRPESVQLIDSWVRSGYRVAFICDEIHHTESVGAGQWGGMLNELNRLSSATIVMSGTYFRTDSRPISLLEYKSVFSNGDVFQVPRTDFQYTYREAIKDRICRPVEFIFRKAEDIEDKESNVIFHTTSATDSQVRSYSSRVMEPGTDLVRDITAYSQERLERLRSVYPDAACLLVCRPGSNRRGQSRVVSIHNQLTASGRHSIWVSHKDADAAPKIDRFRESAAPNLCAVNMVSEGVDIPRCRVVAILRYTESEMLFRQIVGRAVRMMDGDDPRHPAVVVMPDFPRMKEFAKRIESEVQQALDEMPPEESPDCVGDSRDVERDLLPLKFGNVGPGGGAISGINVESEMIERAQCVIDTHPAFGSYSPTVLAAAFKEMQSPPPPVICNDLKTRKEALAKEVVRLVHKELCHIWYRGLPKNERQQPTWTRLIEHFGRPWKEVRKDGRLEDLEQWRDYVSRCIEVDQ